MQIYLSSKMKKPSPTDNGEREAVILQLWDHAETVGETQKCLVPH